MVERNDHGLVSQGDLDFNSGLFPVRSVFSHLNSLGFSALVRKTKGLPKGPGSVAPAVRMCTPEDFCMRFPL